MCAQVRVRPCARRRTRVIVEVYNGGGSRAEERRCWSCCLASRQKSLLGKCGEQGLKRRGESLGGQDLDGPGKDFDLSPSITEKRGSGVIRFVFLQNHWAAHG